MTPKNLSDMANKPKSKPRPWQTQKGDTGKQTEHTSSYERPRSAKEYHTARWTRMSRLFREANPLCVICLKENRVTPSEVVDHVIPFPVCGDFWDATNWQALCKVHNAAKGNRDKKLIQEHKDNIR